jgi:hypothetical protein
LQRAENRIGKRRAALFDWLGQREGHDRLREIDHELSDQAHGVYVVRAIPTEVEWDNYRRAKRCVSQLEKRRKRTGG